MIRTWAKVHNAMSKDDYESWEERDVSRTLNAFENDSDGRATVLVTHEEDDLLAFSAGNSEKSYGIAVGKVSPPVRAGASGTNQAPTVVYAPTVYEPRSALDENWAESEVKNALRAEASRSSHVVVAEPSLVVRRLTPVECERLMGVPDDWTRHRVAEDGTEVEQSDSVRYKQCGNGLAVPVASWIIARIVGRA